MRNYIIAILALLILGGIGYAYNYSTHHHNHTAADSPIDTPAQMDHQEHTVENFSDREFLEHMIPHHQEAVDTAKEVLLRGGTIPELRTLANTIIETQEQEITSMKQWHQDWFGEPYVDDGSYVPMMRDLSTLSGVELDRVFLEDMIEHHMMALTMVNEKASAITKPELLSLMQNIATTQSEEVVQMRILLRQL